MRLVSFMLIIASMMLIIVSMLFQGCAFSGGVAPKGFLANENTGYYLDAQGVGGRDLGKGFTLTTTGKLAIMSDGDSIAGGVGAQVGFDKHLTGGWYLYLTGGPLFLANGGSLDGLASSWIYGDVEAGVRYRRHGIFIEHISSPLHGGEDGDVGWNLLKYRCKW